MNAFVKTSKTYILLIFTLALSLMSACINQAPATDTQVAPSGPPDRIDMVYFYDSNVCQCDAGPGVRIQGTLYINFSKELATGELTFQSIDINDPNNAAIANKYGATSLSLFMNVVTGDTEQTIAVPEILLVKDDDEAIGRLVINKINKYFDAEE